MLAEFLKRTVCALFEVHEDTRDVYRIVTPLEYAGTGDRVVVRVRMRNGAFSIDENGEACLCASMIGGDVESAAIEQWSQNLSQLSPARLDDDEVIRATTTDERLVVPYVFRVAEAAQQLCGVATSRVERRSGSDFKGRLSRTIVEIAEEFDLKYDSEVELPISGKFMADHVVQTPTPSIVIAAMSDTRLLEGELIHMQYREANKPGHVLAIAESQLTVGKAQFERANYYTWKTVVFDARNLRSLIASGLH
ncbi:hypothetical protein AWB74_01568 [Caballeronia arvi]|uniref:Uncharacterized protein n=1 Tax=Caballeronia arvi TaxID=1777135 RepID=A0A158H7J4_9BURK|nr:hypothetical protein AWB74_01568 [Caballeronia arvi]